MSTRRWTSGKPVGSRHCPATVGAARECLHESECRATAAPENRRGIRVRSTPRLGVCLVRTCGSNEGNAMTALSRAAPTIVVAVGSILLMSSPSGAAPAPLTTDAAVGRAGTAHWMIAQLGADGL